VIADPGIFVLGSAAADLSHAIVVLVVQPEVVSVIDEPEAFVLVSVAVEPGIVFVAVVSVAGVAGPQACVDIPAPFDVSAPASAVFVEVDSSGRPRFHVFPNNGHYAISSSFVEVVGVESSHSSTDGHTNHGVRNILSSLGLRQNRKLKHGYNKPIPGHNSVIDTSRLPKDATTSRSRRTNPPRYQEQRKHRAHQGGPQPPGVPQMRLVVAEKYERQRLPLPSLEEGQQLTTQKALLPEVTFSCFIPPCCGHSFALRVSKKEPPFW